jgi:hypothetical protein
MKSRFIGLAAIYMAIPAIVFAQPKEKEQLVGLWELKTSQNDAPTQRPRVGLEIFGEDGSCTTIVGTALAKSAPVLQAMGSNR